ncbi:hypothetical protein BDZ97DRAFT_105729 [Flammula alnicola]|nr:hypothetical protein BDZ97DRAFT_105729 [Flammula alnicola]
MEAFCEDSESLEMFLKILMMHCINSGQRPFELGKHAVDSPNHLYLIRKLVQGDGNFCQPVSKTLNNNANSDPVYIRAKEEADKADKAYRIGVRCLD